MKPSFQEASKEFLNETKVEIAETKDIPEISSEDQMPEITPDSTRETERRHRFDVVIINKPFHTVEELRNILESLGQEKPFDTVLASEFDLEALYAIENIDDLITLAKQTEKDIILAPSNKKARIVWGELEDKLVKAGAQIEVDRPPREYYPESIGMFIGRDGKVFSFPKNSFYSQGPQVHRVPGSNIGVTICAEIHLIKPEELNGINVIFNPSREADDPMVWLRMAQIKKGSPLTRQEIEELLIKDEVMRTYILSETEYLAQAEKTKEGYRQTLDPYYFELSYKDKPLVGEDETPEKRREQFDVQIAEIQKKLSEDHVSFYAKIADGLAETAKEHRVPIFRADGMQNSGILNPIPGMEITDLDIEPDVTRMSVLV